MKLRHHVCVLVSKLILISNVFRLTEKIFTSNNYVGNNIIIFLDTFKRQKYQNLAKITLKVFMT